MIIYASEAGSHLHFSQNLPFSGLSLFFINVKVLRLALAGLCTVSQKVQVLD